jgi:hypothetical protein
LATLPLDRFAALQPQKQHGWLVTKPFKATAEQLQVNADATQGALRVEVLTEQGELMGGFDAASCTPIQTDELRAVVRWHGRSFSSLLGKTIRLKFQLDRARLFAFQLQKTVNDQ